MKKAYVILAVLCIINLIFGQTFTEIDAGLPGVSHGSVVWGDYDNDGDLDILLTGSTVSRIYRNDSGVFTDINAGLQGVSVSSASWGDYDSDGDLDILLLGLFDQFKLVIYNNDSGIFTEIQTESPGWADDMQACWCDYDNDGDLDIIQTNPAVIYRNDSGVFTISVQLNWWTQYESASCGDLDNDSDIDIILSGGYNLPHIYRNDSGEFTEIDIYFDFWILHSSTVAFGDYDNDGDIDFLLTGFNGNEPISRVYRNDSGIFTDINAELSGVSYGSVAWGDYDNDGDLDILLTGSNGNEPISRIYRNDSGIFTDINAGLPGVHYSSASWGDYDNDGDLDILLTGYTGSERISKIYCNNLLTTNTPPVSPANLISSVNGSECTFSWDKATDNETPQNGLSYNIYVGTTSLNEEINPSMSDISTGYRKIVSVGNVNANNSWVVKNLGQGEYYWSVQAVDHAFAGSEFAPEQTFTSTFVLQPPLAVRASEITGTSFKANWQFAAGAKKYFIDVATDSLFINFVTGYENLDIGNVTSYTVLSLSTNIEYYYRVRSFNSVQSENSNFISVIAGPFNESEIELPGVSSSSVAWGDYDNDGDLDILLTGSTVSERISRIYRNDSGVFTDINAGLPGVRYSSASWGDYDNDGDFDILLTGYTGSESISNIYRNDILTPNTPPVSPANLISVVNGSECTFSWDKATDNETPQNGLSYNIYVGTTSLNEEINPSMSDISTGYRKIVSVGNVNENNSWVVKDLGPGEYYWSVQAVDHTFAGSEFAPEQTFTSMFVPQSPVANIASEIRGTSFIANWQVAAGAKKYYIDVATDDQFINLVAGYENLDIGNVTSYTIFSLSTNTEYYYRVRAFNYIQSENSNSICVTTGQFYDLNIELPGVYDGSADWGDYDNDGDLDVLLTGYTVSERISRIYRNDSGVFTDINAELPGVYDGSADWGDYDNDGDLDILLTGDSFGRISRIYRNDSGIFTDINAELIGVSNGSASWGDYDNDGDLDILLTGYTGSERISRIYRNDSGVFTDINAGLIGVSNGSASWGDYDYDGDLDILLTGGGISKIYRNDSGIFTDINAGLQGSYSSPVAWGDFDDDGDLDILSGIYVYRNNSGSFTRLFTIPTDRVDNSQWGDFDNDGDLDILLTGTYDEKKTAYYITRIRIYRNDSGVFTDVFEGLADLISMIWSSVDCGDFDNDGDIDVLLSGSGTERISIIYRNDCLTANTPPGFPINLALSANDTTITFFWDKATDNETPQNGLSYNFYLGTESLQGDLNTSMSDNSSGYRKVVDLGNAQQNTSYTLNKALPIGLYYWSVQAIDHAFAGSEFAPEKSFAILSSPQNVQIKHKDDLLKLTWDEVPGAQMYYVYASDDPESEFINVSKQGIFNGTTWTQAISSVKKFYYVVAVIK